MAEKGENKKKGGKNTKMKALMLLSKEILTDDRVYREAKALIDAGYEVTVIMWDRYGKNKLKENVDEINIIRIQNGGLMKILPNNLFRNPFWWRLAYKKAMELYKGDYKFDIVHCHDLDTLQAGVWLKKKLGIKLIYDAHEIFGYMIKDGHPILSKYSFKMEKKMLKYCDHIITIDEPFKGYYEKIFNSPITIVMNCKDLVFSRYEPPNNDIFTLVYVGLMDRGRFFPQILEVVGEIKNIKLILAGKKEGLFEEIKEMSKKYKNVEFLGTIPRNEILPLTKKSNATFVIADRKGQHHLNVFNKQFEAMVAGRPIIVTKGTYAAKMTEELQCGITVDYSKESVREAIIKLRDDPGLCEKLGKNAFKAAKERYNWEKEKKKLIRAYEEII